MTDRPARQGTARFFVAALGITWFLQLPAVLAQRGIITGPVERFLPLVALGGFGPLLAAVLVSRLESGGEGGRALFRSLGTWRVGVAWYLVAFGLFGAIFVAGRAVYGVFGGSVSGPWVYLPETPAQIVAMIMFPLAEEPGWRGFALPRLQRRYGPLVASLVVGVLWSLWHTMMFILQGASPGTFALMTANIVAGSVLFTWFYNRTRGSLLLAILLHVGVHLSNPTHALPANVAPFVLYTVSIAVVACGLLLADRAPWRRSAATRSPSRSR